MAWRTVLVLAVMARAAWAAPVAAVREDVDGDGAADAIELGGDGVVRIAGRPGGEVKLAPAIARGELAVTRYRGKPYVTAQIVAAVGAPGATGSEAVILSVDGGHWHEVARFALGGVGLDHDYGVAVDPAPDGIYRYQTRSDIRRCDGKPAYLFAEKFDGARFRRTSALPVNVGAVPVLAGKIDPAPALAPLLYQAHAASHEVGVGDAGGLAIPRELDDGAPGTVWREELAASAGEGQFFTFEPRAADARARQLRLIGVRGGNRVRRVAIVAASGAWRADLPDVAGEPVVVELPAPVAGCVTVILEATYGPPQGATAIAELEVFAEGERGGGGEALLARVVADGADGATTAAATLARRGAAGAAAIEQALATAEPAARRRLIGALAASRDPAAAPALVRAAAAGWVRDQDLLDVIAALGALGQGQALRDVAVDAALPVAARAAAIARITELAALIEIAGEVIAQGAARRPPGEPARAAARSAPPPEPAAPRDEAVPADHVGRLQRTREAPEDGTRALRRAIIEQVSRAPAEAVIAAAGAQAVPAVAGDLWRAAVRGARQAPASRAAVVAAMRTALPAATDYERRYRLIDGLAALGDAAAIAEVEAALAALPADAQAAALRQVAVRAIAGAPRPEAAAFVVAAARDRDPGVRLAALGALPDGGDGDAVLGEALAQDAWPEVRRRAASGLGGRCQRPGPAAALTDAVARDRDLAVRGDALSALVQCRAANAAALLAWIWDDDRAPLALRTRAVLEAIALGDPQLAKRLVGKLARWRGEAVQSEAALALAQAAAAAVGRLAPPGAARALADALDDTAFPEIVQAAALGLAALGPACPADARAKLVELGRSDDQSAIAARRAAAQCGAGTGRAK
jgi:hypothetical protein